jgi:hypothetical protein
MDPKTGMFTIDSNLVDDVTVHGLGEWFVCEMEKMAWCLTSNDPQCRVNYLHCLSKLKASIEKKLTTDKNLMPSHIDDLNILISKIKRAGTVVLFVHTSPISAEITQIGGAKKSSKKSSKKASKKSKK